MSAISVFKCNLTRNSRVRKWIFLESHNWIKWEKKKTAFWFYPEIDEIDDVDAKQYHRASFSTRNSALNTSLRKPIRMQDFIQLCDSISNLSMSPTFRFVIVLTVINKVNDLLDNAFKDADTPTMSITDPHPWWLHLLLWKTPRFTAR